jgi:nitroimidazol reductase NimA-like FMN-containing flavoprotein (pyridoxamine 5'-phosphate oxidase superfamily)
MSSDLLRSIVDKNPYMTLATADENGAPWATPVWFATADYREFVWVSDPRARHSRNLASRPELGIVIFDSQQRPYTSEAVYLSAVADLVPEDELDRCLGLFSAVSRRQELPEWKRADVDPPARLRLYRATATHHYVLTGRDERIPVELP